VGQVKAGCYFVTGGAGFIASNLVDALIERGHSVVAYDNFSTGQQRFLEQARTSSRFKLITGDLLDADSVTRAMSGCDVVCHLGANADVRFGTEHPRKDLEQNTIATFNVLEAMRRSGTRTILYASGSGVYGDLGELEVAEHHGPLVPISTYGASKLAGEALISSYCHMFDFTGRAFRFGNVVGPRQTHGVGFDFLRKLMKDRHKLEILGDGTQSKSYIHVRDIVEAVLLSAERPSERFAVYNVASDYITVTEIARLAAECAGLDPREVKFEYTGGSRGWKGDVPIVRLNTDRIRGLGWVCRMNSREALRDSMKAMLADLKAGRL